MNFNDQLNTEQKKEKARIIYDAINCAFFDDEERYSIIQIGDKLFVDPYWSAYVNWADKYGLDGSIDAAIEKAFSYKPIILGPPSDS